MHAKEGYQIGPCVHLKFYSKVLLVLVWGRSKIDITYFIVEEKHNIMRRLYLNLEKKREKHSTVDTVFYSEVFVLGLSIGEKKITPQVTTELVYNFKQSLEHMQT